MGLWEKMSLVLCFLNEDFKEKEILLESLKTLPFFFYPQSQFWFLTNSWACCLNSGAELRGNTPVPGNKCPIPGVLNILGNVFYYKCLDQLQSNDFRNVECFSRVLALLLWQNRTKCGVLQVLGYRTQWHGMLHVRGGSEQQYICAA